MASPILDLSSAAPCLLSQYQTLLTQKKACREPLYIIFNQTFWRSRMFNYQESYCLRFQYVVSVSKGYLLSRESMFRRGIHRPPAKGGSAAPVRSPASGKADAVTLLPLPYGFEPRPVFHTVRVCAYRALPCLPEPTPDAHHSYGLKRPTTPQESFSAAPHRIPPTREH